MTVSQALGGLIGGVSVGELSIFILIIILYIKGKK